MKVKTLFISDVHLGTSKCQADKLLNVLRDYDYQELVIVGDFIDLTSLKRKFYWKADHSTVIQKILRASRKGTKVTYILGNHDYFLRGLIKEDNINLGDILNNKIRRFFGLEYWSLSQYLKSKVKNAISFINDFKILSMKRLEEVECDSIMIGHIHTPAIEKIGEKTYYNTGDFCESCSFLYEDLSGDIKLVILD